MKKISTSNFYSYVTVAWLTPLVWKGKTNPLKKEDLLELDDKDRAGNIYEKFEPYLRRENDGHPSNLVLFIAKVVFLPMLGLLLSSALAVAVSMATPIFLEMFINLLDTSYEGSHFIKNVYVLTGILFGLQLFAIINNAMSGTIKRRVSHIVHSGLQSIIYEKSFKLTLKARKEYPVGKIMTMLTTDVGNISRLFLDLRVFLFTPIQLLLTVYFLSTFIGVSVLWGVLVLLGGIGASVLCGYLEGEYCDEYEDLQDERVTLISDMVKGIQMIKCWALESSFYKKNLAARAEQGKALLKYSAVVDSGEIAIKSVPSLFLMVIIAAYTRSNSLTAGIIFPVISYSLSLVDPLFDVLDILGILSQGWVGLKRVSSYLNAPELLLSNRDGVKGSVVVENVTWKWLESGKGDDQDPSATFSLQEINLNVNPGESIAISGPIGSGKSSLLSGLLSEMDMVHGSVKISGRIAYCPQKPWILAASIEDNITFGSLVDQEKLDAVVKATSLNRDLEILPHGIKTQLGENGITLSGGQKARVALARALYADAHVYLLDCPLAALDAKVSQEVFQSAILGHLKNKTVLMVTHNKEFFSGMDKVVYMDGGKVKEIGNTSELLAKPEFVDLLEANRAAKEDEMEETSTKFSDTESNQSQDEAENDSASQDNQVIEKEDQAEGSVGKHNYMKLASICGPTFIPLFVGVVFAAGSFIGTPLWISYWTSHSSDSNQQFYLNIFEVFGAASILSNFILYGSTMLMSWNIVQYLHHHSIAGILAAPMSFFHANPSGRIISRLGTDINDLDTSVNSVIFNIVDEVLAFFSTVILCSQASWYMVIAFVLMLIPCYQIYIYYSATNIELKRLFTVSRSPLMSWFSESLAGNTIIRVFEKENVWNEKQKGFSDSYLSTRFIYLSLSIWLSFRLQLLCSLFTLAICLIGAVQSPNAQLAASIGVSLTYSSQIADSMQRLLAVLGAGEGEMNTVERLLHYAHEIPQEPPSQLKTDPSNWPKDGNISVSSLTIAYPSKPDVPVIRDLSFKINGGERVGIVGRTGSGKSTFVSSLFRIINDFQGSIEIDGVDISKIGIKTLRSGLFMIPQDPILFSGTIRSNIDMLNEYTDKQLWDALECCGLKEFVAGLPEGLEEPVESEGENFSAGQKQLLCIVLAVLKKPKIIVFDEATSALDYKSDEIVQELIHNELKGCTVITIAHRLNTIAAYDKLLVLDQGKLAEYDSPASLLQQDSLFRELALASGKDNFELLKQLAK